MSDKLIKKTQTFGSVLPSKMAMGSGYVVLGGDEMSNIPQVDMQGLVDKILSIHQELKRTALRSVNTLLTLRNWLIGYHIAHYELQGADRTQYGERVIENIAFELQRKKVPRSTKRELQRFCQFYRLYPQIGRSLNAQSSLVSPDIIMVEEAEPDDSQSVSAKVRSLNAQLEKLTDNILTSLSYAHFEILITIDDELKRRFYELECLRANWSVRQLRRQIKSLYYQRSLLSVSTFFASTASDSKIYNVEHYNLAFG